MNLEMCNECLNYKILNEYGRCQECELIYDRKFEDIEHMNCKHEKRDFEIVDVFDTERMTDVYIEHCDAICQECGEDVTISRVYDLLLNKVEVL